MTKPRSRAQREASLAASRGSANAGYYRPRGVNPNWYDIWTEQADEGVPPEEICDELCRLACGIAACGPSDETQRYAEHIHAHIIAAFKAGQHSPNGAR